MTKDTALPILKTTSSAIPERLLVVGDPDRVSAVSRYLDGVTEISRNREYLSVKGAFNGEEIGVVSHGVGSAGAGACFEELCRSGAKRIIRVGSAGGMQENIAAGDIVVATGAVREDGLSQKLVPTSYPATVSADVLTDLRASVASLGFSCVKGLVLTSDLFYPHEVLGSDLHVWQRAGVSAVEMECATLFVICSLHGVQAGAVVAIDGNPLARDDTAMDAYNPRQDAVKDAVNTSIQIALHALIT